MLAECEKAQLAELYWRGASGSRLCSLISVTA